MSNPRIYQNQPLTIGETITLSDDAFGHTVRVLRLKDDDSPINHTCIPRRPAPEDRPVFLDFLQKR